MTAIAATTRRLVDRPALLRVGVAVAAIAVAYHYSLITLARNLGVDTPLAYVGLAPLIAVVLAFHRGRPVEGELEVHDRQFDWIVGVPLLATSLAILTILPENLSTLFWVWRLDLLSLPLFAAGIVSICFGARALWRVRVALAFLLLAWPLPYTVTLGRLLDVTTAATLAGLKLLLQFVPVASAIPGQPSFFSIDHGGDSFPVNVASACAGVNGIIGFLLLGLAFGVAVRGSRKRKALWLGGGLLLLWSLNVVRILGIFAAGRQWGESVAIDVFHPYVGLVTFNIGVFAMVVAMPAFGLRFGRPDTHRLMADGPAAMQRAVPSFKLVILIVVTATTLVAIANAELRDYELVADELGAPRLSSFSAAPHAPAGWDVKEVNRYPWGRQYFGRDAEWIRYRFSGAPATASRTAGVTLGAASKPAASKPAASMPVASKPAAKGDLSLTNPKPEATTTSKGSLALRTTPSPKVQPLQSTFAAGSAKAQLGRPRPSGPSGPPIYADVITTSNLRSFSTFGVAQCYRFHGYRLDEEREIDLGGGITGLLVAYHNTKLASDWTSVSWVWPVATPEGTRYERVTVMTKVATRTSTSISSIEEQPEVGRDELIAFATELIGGQSERATVAR